MKDTEQLVMISGIKPYKTPSQKEKELRSFCGKFQRWSDKKSQIGTTADGKCGYMNCCNYCKSSADKNPCAKAMRYYLKAEKIAIDLSQSFEKVMEVLDY